MIFCNHCRINFSRVRDRRAVRRRGVLLLVVLSLLVLFVLAGLSFIVVASQYKKSSIPGTRVDRNRTPPEKLLNTTSSLLLSPPTTGSALSGHGLLRDLYGGEDGFNNTIGSITPVVNDQFQRVVLSSAPINAIGQPVRGLAGRVLTMTEGPAEGQSTRIVAHDSANNAIWIESFLGSQPGPGNTFIVNGLPFNGTGAGFERDFSQNIDLTDDTYGEPYALLPGFADYTTMALVGGADESYDAPDFQNMALGWMRSDANGGEDIIPSFNRPALLNYMRNKYDDYASIPLDVLRGILLRPNSIDHPNFSGSNPWLDKDVVPDPEVRFQYLIDGTTVATPDAYISTWDIDNDGDGLADSIWIDAGLPTESTADGRQYKPLVAILCLDLDGRINLNTADIKDDFGFTGMVATGDFDRRIAGPAGSVTVTNLWPHGANSYPYGIGMGPAEINITTLFTGNDWLKVLNQRYSSTNTSDEYPGTTGSADNVNPSWYKITPPALLGTPTDLLARGGLYLDHNGQPMTSQLLGNEDNVTAVRDHPYELNVVRPNGRDAIYGTAELETILRPYDIDSSGMPRRLTAFSNALAPFADTRSVTTRSFEIPVAAIPVPDEIRGTLTSTGTLNSPASIYDIFDARLFTVFTIDGLNPATIPTEIENLLPFELKHGERMNLNRLFGNGVDDGLPGAGVVDEPGEAMRPILQQLAAGNVDQARKALSELVNDDPVLIDAFDYAVDHDPPLPPPQAPIRQLYARHIYALLQFLRDTAAVELAGGATPPAMPGLPGGPRGSYESAKILAQWAINVVDFCDRDSIMTPFEVDLNPFNGWQVDGNLKTFDELLGGVPNPDRAVVWGTERPELLITETVAWHDRRVEDRDDETRDINGVPMIDGTKTTDPTIPDTELDQFAFPRGAMFVELFNPWSGSFSIPGAELYDATGRLHLDRVVTDPTSNRTSAVWRLVTSPSGPNRPTPINIDEDPYPAQDERYVYFVRSSVYTDANFAPKNTGSSEQDYYTGSTEHTRPILVAPGQYAVVGSGTKVPSHGVFAPERYLATAGFETALASGFEGAQPGGLEPMINYASTRHIELRPESGPNQVRVIANGGTDDLTAPHQPKYADIRPTVAIVVNQPQPFTISEPRGGYTAANAVVDTNYTTLKEPVLTETRDIPLDFALDAGAIAYDRFQDNSLELYGAVSPLAAGVPPDPGDLKGVIPSYRIIYLQRLANPLLPWNPPPGESGHDEDLEVNPYRTIDSAEIDLTVFNGFDLPTAYNSTPTPDIAFHAKQRGDSSGGGGQQRTLWGQEPLTNVGDYLPTPASIATIAPTDHHFNYLLRTTLGYLNTGYQPAFTANDAPASEFIGSPNTTAADPFPWLPFNNRPFANRMELLQVPRFSSFKLLAEFDVLPGTTKDTFDPSPHPNLMSLLASSGTGGAGGTDTDDPGLYRIFELVEVPSRFAGTRTWYNETDLKIGYMDPANPPPPGFRQYYNSLSRFRDPGKINLNTISDVRVWGALAYSIGVPEATLFDLWDDQAGSGIDLARRGYDNAAAVVDKTSATEFDNTNLDPALPTQFANPFRAGTGGDLSPLPSSPIMTNVKGKDATLMRTRAGVTDTLLDMASRFTDQHDNAARNSMFRYQALQKLDSRTTTRSNVYAVWITLGYFEATPDSSGTVPGGFILGQELGADTGEIERHRGFYIIDRSIPVGYEPGKKHNADDTIVLQRFIE